MAEETITCWQTILSEALAEQHKEGRYLEIEYHDAYATMFLFWQALKAALERHQAVSTPIGYNPAVSNGGSPGPT